MKIYISIPISNMDEKKQREKVDKIKMALSKHGYEAINPFEIYAGKNPSYFEKISYNILALSECDTVFFCKGWQDDQGCRFDRAFCDIYGRKMKFESVEPVEIYYR